MSLPSDELRTRLTREGLSAEQDGFAPSDDEQIRCALRLANECGAALYPVGGRTHIDRSVLRDDSICLHMGQYDGIAAHEVEDLTVTVRAGTTIAQLDRVLQQHGQFVAVHALDENRATLGGTVVHGEASRYQLRFGGIKDQVLGLDAYLVDGTRARSGGRLVKNVTGYELHKLLIGSRGTLAVVTEISLRTRPRPSSCGVIAVGFDDRQSAWQFAIDVRDLNMTTLDTLTGVPAAALIDDVETEFVVAATWHGAGGPIRLRLEETERLLSVAAKKLVWEHGEHVGDRARKWLDVRRACWRDGAAMIALHGRPSRMLAVENTWRTALGDAFAGIWSEDALGCSRIMLRDPEPERLGRAIHETLRERGHDAIVPDWAFGPQPERLDWPAPEGHALMKRIKHSFDANGILAPGCLEHLSPS